MARHSENRGSSGGGDGGNNKNGPWNNGNGKRNSNRSGNGHWNNNGNGNGQDNWNNGNGNGNRNRNSNRSGNGNGYGQGNWNSGNGNGNENGNDNWNNRNLNHHNQENGWNQSNPPLKGRPRNKNNTSSNHSNHNNYHNNNHGINNNNHGNGYENNFNNGGGGGGPRGWNRNNDGGHNENEVGSQLRPRPSNDYFADLGVEAISNIIGSIDITQLGLGLEERQGRVSITVGNTVHASASRGLDSQGDTDMCYCDGSCQVHKFLSLFGEALYWRLEYEKGRQEQIILEDMIRAVRPGLPTLDADSIRRILIDHTRRA